VKSDGQPTYRPGPRVPPGQVRPGQLAPHRLWGADTTVCHPLKAGMQASATAEELEIILGQLVSLVRGGERCRLSKRAGEIVLLQDSSTSVGRTWPAHVPPPVARHPPDHRPRLITAQSNETPSSTCSTRTRGSTRSAGRRPRQAWSARRSGRRPVACSSTDRESTCSQCCPSPRGGGLACQDRRRTGDHVGPRLADRFTAFYHDCYVIGDVPANSPRPAFWLVEAARIGLSIGLSTLGVSAPEAM